MYFQFCRTRSLLRECKLAESLLQTFRLQGFDEMTIKPRSYCSAADIVLTISSECNQVDACKCGFGSDFMGQCIAIDGPRQSQIRNYDIGDNRDRQLRSLWPIVGHENLVTDQLQRHFQRDGRVSIVLNQQDSQQSDLGLIRKAGVSFGLHVQIGLNR